MFDGREKDKLIPGKQIEYTDRMHNVGSASIMFWE